MGTSPDSSQLLPSITSLSASASRHGSSHISKIYRQAKTLFLTRRLPESLSTISPIITPPEPSDDDTIVQGQAEQAPISNSSKSTRVKVWGLYIALLNSIVGLDRIEGKQAFGSSEWHRIVSEVRDGRIWEEIVTHGYHGMEGEVDAEVVLNLTTLLLSHARTQKLTQQRLEYYLAACSMPDLDISARISASSPRSSSLDRRGTSTPRDLHVRVKILELYTLHVLPHNSEWDYSKEFIAFSADLDEERREVFLQTLENLRREKDESTSKQKEEAEKTEQELRNRRISEVEEKNRITRSENVVSRNPGSERVKQGSETDYGIEPAGMPSKLPQVSPMKAPIQKLPTTGREITSRSSQNVFNRAGMILRNLKVLLEELARSWKMNPLALLRVLTFVLGIVMLLGRRDFRDGARMMWMKLRQTLGMGMKVSYI